MIVRLDVCSVIKGISINYSVWCIILHELTQKEYLMLKHLVINKYLIVLLLRGWFRVNNVKFLKEFISISVYKWTIHYLMIH